MKITRKFAAFILVILLTAAFFGCAENPAPQAEELSFSAVGEHKIAAPYGDGLVFIDFDGRLMHFSGGNTEVIYDARHCYGPISTEGGDILFTRLMSGPWGVEVVRFCENGELTTLETRFDEVYLIANGTVFGVSGGEYIQVSTADGTKKRICEVPEKFSPAFCADGVFYDQLPSEERRGLATFALSDRYGEASLPTSMCFGNDTIFLGYDSHNMLTLRRSDLTIESTPDARPLALVGNQAYFITTNSYFFRIGALCRTDGVTTEQLMQKLSLANTNQLDSRFQVYGDLVFFQTVHKNSTASYPSPEPVSLSAKTPIYTYILDTSSGTLHLACEN